MDVYVQQITGSTNHDLFYTDAQVIVSVRSDLLQRCELNIPVRYSGSIQKLRPDVCQPLCERTDHFGMGAG